MFFATFLKVQACDFLIVFVRNLSIRKLILDFSPEDLEDSVDLEHVIVVREVSEFWFQIPLFFGHSFLNVRWNRKRNTSRQIINKMSMQ